MSEPPAKNIRSGADSITPVAVIVCGLGFTLIYGGLWYLIVSNIESAELKRDVNGYLLALYLGLVAVCAIGLIVSTQGEQPGDGEAVGKDGYHAYLASDAWQVKRRAALARAGGRCQLCNSRWSVQVHHRTYDRLGREADGDLIVLCADCHATFHGKLNA